MNISNATFFCNIYFEVVGVEQNFIIGSVYENAVAQELIAHGFRTKYFNSKRHGELDFVVERDGLVVPI